MEEPVGEHIWFASCTCNGRGVGILICKSVTLKFLSKYSNPHGIFLILSVTINGLLLLLVNVYAPNDEDPDFY